MNAPTLERFRPPDHLGSSSTLTDSNGYVFIKDRYSAFGERRQGESSAALITDQLYTAQRYNALSSLYHYSDGSGPGRFYDPLLGRFVKPDSITPGKASQSLNRYAYSFNNPIRYTDPNGQTPWDVVDFLFWWWSVKDFFQTPSWSNAGWLIVDTASLLPITPSTGWFRRGAKLFLNKANDIADAIEGAKHLTKITTRAAEISDEAANLVLVAAQKGEGRVFREGLQGSLDAAKMAAKAGDEILPGLYKYGGESIPGYAQHHLWPQAMGGPKEGWAIYAKQPHHGVEGIQGRLNTYLRDKLGMAQRQLEEWARANPEEILPHLRDFYQKEGIEFPY